MRYVRGTELWARFFDADRRAYRPGLLGVIERVDPKRGALCCGKWVLPGTWPLFGSEAEARRFCDEHPFEAPEAPSHFGNAQPAARAADPPA